MTAVSDVAAQRKKDAKDAAVYVAAIVCPALLPS